MLGMGVFYTQKCEGWSLEDIEGFCEKKGFLELCPTIALSSTAVDVERIGKAWGVEEITYLEMLVTTIMARGRGVAGGIVKAVEEAVEQGVIAAVASSVGTERILRRRGWQVWNTLDCSQFVFRKQKLFSGLKPLTVFLKDLRE